MREELIINGQHCDLGEGTGITLEYVSNLLNEPGKISLSHSYTIKLPRTANNARILDLPELPAHESSMARRYLPVNYYRNGINLIGDNAHAYLTSATDEQYELVLIWDDIPELRTLSESEATINDLPDLPVLNWVGNSYGVDDNGALFAKYASSNAPKDTSGVNELIHPCMRMPNLVQRIFNQAGVPFSYALGGGRPGHPARLPLASAVVLAAPSHKPNAEMLRAAGAFVYRAVAEPRVGSFCMIYPRYGETGLNALDGQIYYGTDGCVVLRDGRECTVDVTFITKAGSGANLSGATLQVIPALDPGSVAKPQYDIVLAEAPIDAYPLTFGCVSRLQVTLPEGYTAFCLGIKLAEGNTLGELVTILELEAFGSGSLICAYRYRETINTNFENEFPVEGNLPDLTQWEFIRNYITLSGLVPQPHQGRLNLVKVSYMLDISRAVDWTDKLNDAEDQTVRPRGNDWAQRNLLKFADNPDNNRDPGFSFDIQDTTLKSERDWAALDFAASLNNTAIHYKSNDNGETYEDVDIKPRFFTYNGANYTLSFTSDLYGEGLKAKYAKLQSALEKPVYLETTMRLTEIDLATLDLTRPVYLAQYGQYYHILKVQTSGNDMCKVELLQLR